MKHTLLLSILLGLCACAKKNKETTGPVIRDMEILNEEDLEGLPES